MKVKCTQCGKRFDYDVYTGICPKCSAFYRVGGNDGTVQESTATVRTYETQNKATDAVHKAGQKARKRKHSRLYYAATAVLSVAIILSAVLAHILAGIANEAGYALGSMDELPEPVYLSVGESAVVPYDENGFTFAVTGAVIVDDDVYQVPVGYEFVTISYRTGMVNSNDEAGYNDYRSYSTRRGLRPYLMTKSGNYLPPLDEYDLEKVGIMDYEIADQPDISTYFRDTEGFFCFLVKENDMSGLRINCHREQSDVWGNTVDPLVSCYEITELEVD